MGPKTVPTTVGTDLIERLEREADRSIPIRFRVLLRRQKIVTFASLGILLLVFGVLGVSLGLGISPPAGFGRVILVVLIADVLAAGLFLYVNWSCPRCGKYLGESRWFPGWNITHCRYCGVHLR